MKTNKENFIQSDFDENIDIDDYPIGWPNGVTPPPMEYNLGLINRYLKTTNKSFDELTKEELERFKHDVPHTI